MASDKSRRKADKVKKKATDTGPAKPHPDGDRRHRLGASAKAAVRDKHKRNQGDLPPML